MAPSFWIQASNPRAVARADAQDNTLLDAMQTIFPMYAEDALVNWGPVRIPLSYKYDLSVISIDLLMFLEAITTAPKGTLQIDWPSDSFAGIWRVSWENGVCSVRAEWRNLAGGAEVLANQHPSVVIEVPDMVAEWGELLSVAHRLLTESGYSVQQIPELARLKQALAGQRRGLLYR